MIPANLIDTLREDGRIVHAYNEVTPLYIKNDEYIFEWHFDEIIEDHPGLTKEELESELRRAHVIIIPIDGVDAKEELKKYLVKPESQYILKKGTRYFCDGTGREEIADRDYTLIKYGFQPTADYIRDYFGASDLFDQSLFLDGTISEGSQNNGLPFVIFTKDILE